MLILCPIQPALNSSTRELVLAGIISIVDGYLVLIVKTCFRRIRFFLFNILNSVSRTKCFNLSSQLPKRYLDKVLIVRPTNINFLLDTWVVANDQFSYFMFEAMVNYQLRTLIQIVANAVVTPLIESCLFVGKCFYALLVFLRLKISILLVVELINAFKFFAINQKLMPISINTTTKVIHSQIYSNSLIGINRCFYFFIFIYVLNFKPSSMVLRMYSYLLYILIFEPFGKLNFNLAVFLFKFSSLYI